MSELLRKAIETMKLLKKKPHLKPVAAGGGELSKAERWRTAQMAQDWLNANADPKYHRRRLPDMEENGQFKLLTRGRLGMRLKEFRYYQPPGGYYGNPYDKDFAQERQKERRNGLIKAGIVGAGLLGGGALLGRGLYKVGKSGAVRRAEDLAEELSKLRASKAAADVGNVAPAPRGRPKLKSETPPPTPPQTPAPTPPPQTPPPTPPPTNVGKGSKTTPKTKVVESLNNSGDLPAADAAAEIDEITAAKPPRKLTARQQKLANRQAKVAKFAAAQSGGTASVPSTPAPVPAAVVSKAAPVAAKTTKKVLNGNSGEIVEVPSDFVFQKHTGKWVKPTIKKSQASTPASRVEAIKSSVRRVDDGAPAPKVASATNEEFWEKKGVGKVPLLGTPEQRAALRKRLEDTHAAGGFNGKVAADVIDEARASLKPKSDFPEGLSDKLRAAGKENNPKAKGKKKSKAKKQDDDDLDDDLDEADDINEPDASAEEADWEAKLKENPQVRAKKSAAKSDSKKPAAKAAATKPAAKSKKGKKEAAPLSFADRIAAKVKAKRAKKNGKNLSALLHRVRYFNQFQTDEAGIPLTGRVARDRFVKKLRDEDLDRRDANILRAGGAGALAGLLARGRIGASKRALIGAGAGGLGVIGIRALTNNDRDIYGERDRGSKRAELLPAVGGLGAAAWLAGKRLKAFAAKFNHNRAPGQAGGRATEGWPRRGETRGSERVKGHRGHRGGVKEFARGKYAIPALGKMLKDQSLLEEFVSGQRGPKLGDLDISKDLRIRLAGNPKLARSMAKKNTHLGPGRLTHANTDARNWATDALRRGRKGDQILTPENHIRITARSFSPTHGSVTLKSPRTYIQWPPRNLESTDLAARLRAVKNFDDYRLYYFKGRNTGIAARSAEEARKKKKRGGDELVAVRTPSDSERSQMARGVWVRTRRDGKSPGQSRYGKGRGQGPARKSMGAKLRVRFFEKKRLGPPAGFYDKNSPEYWNSPERKAEREVLRQENGLMLVENARIPRHLRAQGWSWTGRWDGTKGGGSIYSDQDGKDHYIGKDGFKGFSARLRAINFFEKRERGMNPYVGAGLSGFGSGAALGSLALLKRGATFRGAAKTAAKLGLASAGIVGGGALLGSKIVGDPRKEESAPFMKRAAIGGTLVGAGAGLGGALLLRKTKGGARALVAASKKSEPFSRPAMWLRKTPLAGAAAIGAVGGAFYGGGMGADEGQQVDSIRNLRKDMKKFSVGSFQFSGKRLREFSAMADTAKRAAKAVGGWAKRNGTAIGLTGAGVGASVAASRYGPSNKGWKKLDEPKEFGRGDQARWDATRGGGVQSNEDSQFANTAWGWATDRPMYVPKRDDTGRMLRDKDGNAERLKWDPSSGQLWNSIAREAKNKRVTVQRGGRLSRDLVDELRGAPRQRDASGRIKKREWEKSWFHNKATEIGMTAAGLGGLATVRYANNNPDTKIGQAWKDTQKSVRATGDGLSEIGKNILGGLTKITAKKAFSAKLKRLRELDAIAEYEGWDVRDPRGRSARVFAPGSRKRERRQKEWHEKTENERKLWKAGIGAGVLGGVGLTLVGQRLISGKSLIPSRFLKKRPIDPSKFADAPPSAKEADEILKKYSK